MIKQTLSAVLLVLVTASGTLAQDKVRVSEHLNWVQTGAGEVILQTNLAAPDLYAFESGPFMTFSVQPSPKADAILFELWGQSRHQWWVGYQPQAFEALVKLNLVSSLIPDNVDVSFVYGLTGIWGLTHSSDRTDRNKGSWKVLLRRDSMLREYPDFWFVTYSDGTEVPREDAQRILNALIDGGFGVEISVSGSAQGVRSFSFYAFQAEISRLVKK